MVLLASMAIVGLGWFGRWDLTIAGALLIAGVSAFAFGAPLGEEGLPTILLAAAFTQYRISEREKAEAYLRKHREFEAERKQL